ncbi:MAG: WecB/TagA/CpsF family glycosyltransferase [Janthinobacterium lividum]
MEAEFPISGMELALSSHALRHAALTCPVLEVPIAVTTMAGAIQQVNDWISTATRAHLVTFVNAHMAVEAQLKPSFRRSLRAMDLNCPDGAPIFWLARKQHGQSVAKIAGPEFMPLFCEQSVALGHRHFLYGGTEGTAEEACAALRKRYPGIQIAGHYCPPFRPLTAPEREDVVNTINQSEADVVWVCLGCPKQEQWMTDMRDHLQAKVVLAVGQAFDIVAGRTRRAPALLRHCGAEWAYRLAKEPRRLWKRYLVTNMLFILFVLRDSLDQRRDQAFQARTSA